MTRMSSCPTPPTPPRWEPIRPPRLAMRSIPSVPPAALWPPCCVCPSSLHLSPTTPSLCFPSFRGCLKSCLAHEPAHTPPSLGRTPTYGTCCLNQHVCMDLCAVILFALSGYNLHTVNVTNLKYLSQWVLTNAHQHHNPDREHFHHPGEVPVPPSANLFSSLT